MCNLCGGIPPCAWSCGHNHRLTPSTACTSRALGGAAWAVLHVLRVVLQYVAPVEGGSLSQSWLEMRLQQTSSSTYADRRCLQYEVGIAALKCGMLQLQCLEADTAGRISQPASPLANHHSDHGSMAQHRRFGLQGVQQQPPLLKHALAPWHGSDSCQWAGSCLSSANIAYIQSLTI